MAEGLTLGPVLHRQNRVTVSCRSLPNVRRRRRAHLRWTNAASTSRRSPRRRLPRLGRERHVTRTVLRRPSARAVLHALECGHGAVLAADPCVRSPLDALPPARAHRRARPLAGDALAEQPLRPPQSMPPTTTAPPVRRTLRLQPRHERRAATRN